MLQSFQTHEPVATPLDEVDVAYRDHADALERYSLRLTHNEATAEDIVQEAFVRLAVEMRAGRRPQNVRAWLYRVVTNLVTSRGRRLKVADRHLASLLDMGHTPSPESVAIIGERDSLVRDALAGLPSTDRRAVLLAAHGYRGPEIAELIGRSEGATRTLLCRARSRLRTELVEAGAV